ncbi:hypothetical protein PAXRUDRAFT_836566, partial [Paxillus rubicundulus Ve08.2h10]
MRHPSSALCTSPQFSKSAAALPVMLPVRAHDEANYLLMNVIVYQTLAISASRQRELSHSDSDDEDFHASTARPQLLARTSTTLLAIASLLLHNQRGPYNQWRKCNVAGWALYPAWWYS